MTDESSSSFRQLLLASLKPLKTSNPKAYKLFASHFIPAILTEAQTEGRLTQIADELLATIDEPDTDHED